MYGLKGTSYISLDSTHNINKYNIECTDYFGYVNTDVTVKDSSAAFPVVSLLYNEIFKFCAF